MRIYATLALLGTFALAACGGGAAGGSATSGGSILPGGGSGNSTQSVTENAITVANSVGTPMKTVQTINSSTSPLSFARHALSVTPGQCNNGFEFFAPDKNNDANSTESQWFYDSSCTQLARDIVRIYTPLSASAETVSRTVKVYAQGNTTASTVRTDSVTFTNATFDKNGFASVTAGFDRVGNNTLDIAGSRTIDSNDETVMLPASSGVNEFCGDSAGFNATGIASLNETFGWQGGTLQPGTRTLNSDGSVTWQSTHTGNGFKGAIGSLSVNTGTQNTACPITTPMFTLSGGTQGGSYSIPITATYAGGELTNLTVSNAQLANGNSLNVVTNAGQPPLSSTFISGTIANAGTQIATFAVNAFGDGTLTVTSSGTQYVMNDWHVVK